VKYIARTLLGAAICTAVGSASAKSQQATTCVTDTAPFAAQSSMRWDGWAPDASNRRYQNAKNAALTPADVPKLTLAWAFKLGAIKDARVQPTVVGNRLFVATSEGKAYALDRDTGCPQWTFTAATALPGAMAIDAADGDLRRSVAFFGDLAANVYAVDATAGTLKWKVHVDEHRAARITGAPLLHRGVLYVPVSSYEEVLVFTPGYECCTFRGSLLALDAATGKQLWKSYTIPDSAKATTKSKTGAQQRGPSGAAIWSAPTYDEQRNVLYVATGNNYSDPTTANSDAVVAFDAKSGALLWSRQFTAGDATTMGCDFPGKPACPESDGPDADFGQSPILVTLSNGKRALVVGQKSGVAYAIDPDASGAILWQTRVAKGGKVGGMQWGSAADDRNMYAAVSDAEIRSYADSSSPAGFSLDIAPDRGGGLAAIDLLTGKEVWHAAPAAACGTRKHCGPAQSAAVTVIPGAVFSGAMDGHLRAYDPETGRVIWDMATMREYDVVNGGKANGGSLDVGGAVVTGGMVFVSSGYGTWGGTPGNVLLAFRVK
jgi:polyvinyl alcohol dehydrogenase (cytochrome)